MRALLALALGVALLAPPAGAFLSTPPGDSVHDDVTEEAARPLGFEGEAMAALKGAVRHPDLVETKVDYEEGRPIALAGERYEAAHHCDRMPTSGHWEAFTAAAHYIRSQRDFAIQAAKAGAYNHSLKAAGRALHALQDCHSHTDIAERPQDEQAAFRSWLLRGEGPVFGIRVAGFSVHDDEEPSNWPPGDPYPHGDHNRDGENSTPDAAVLLPDGRTKFEAARAFAVLTTAAFLEAYLADLTAKEIKGVMDVSPELEDRGFASAPALAIPVLAAAAALRRRRG